MKLLTGVGDRPFEIKAVNHHYNNQTSLRRVQS
jgi:hypothetical protein